MEARVKTLLNKSDIMDYQRDGAIVVRGLFNDWINPLQRGFARVLAQPSCHGRENIMGSEGGRFFEDYCNWQRIPEFRQWIMQSVAARLAAETILSSRVQFFHEHILLKEPGATKPTPWHQDLPYYCVDGNQTVSFWVPLDPVTSANSLQVVLGSHLWEKPVRPTRWLTDEPWYGTSEDFMDMPDIDNGDYPIWSPQMNPGDALLFNFKTVHGAQTSYLSTPRRAFAARFLGDDVSYKARSGTTSPPFKGIGLHDGDPMRQDWFPVVWPK